MKSLSINLTTVLSLLFFGLTASNAQLAEEMRPFDFSNDYYKTNGLIAELLQDRRDLDDKRSVFDTPTDPLKFSSVRILETLPAYSLDGGSIYWNRYAIAPKESFRPDDVGDKAAQIASMYPLYRFPSTSVAGSDRQAVLIATDDRYFEIDQLGISNVFTVVFKEKLTPIERRTLNLLAKQNGISLDGTPIIRTMSQLKELAADGIVRLQVDESAPYLIAKVIQFPDRGGITPDAFLEYVKEPGGEPLSAETHFVMKFECLRNGGNCP
jgi:hypothetical protein